MKNRVIYPGTFDPITNGHLDIIHRTEKMFDEVIIAVAESSTKKTLLTLNERVNLIKGLTVNNPHIHVEGFSGLLINFIKEKQANVLIRGLRNIIDFEYEFGLTGLYKELMPELESIFLTPSKENIFISSTLIRETVLHGGNIRQFVPESVFQLLTHKMNNGLVK